MRSDGTSGAEVPWYLRPRKLYLFSLVLLLLSCLLPAFEVAPVGTDASADFPVEPWPGVQVLCLGWLGAFIGHFGWYANPLLLLATFCGSARFRVIPYLFLVPALVCLSDLALFPQSELPLDEGGVRVGRVSALDSGSFVWLGAVLLGSFGVIRASRMSRCCEKPPVETPAG